MSDYSKSTNFTTKDTLPTGNSNKIVKGTELDTEFTAIASAVASKANTSSPDLLGTPTVPTATTGTNTTQIANTAFVTNATLAERAATATYTNKTLTSPAITGGTVAGVAITGGTISGLSSALPVASGGTGVTTSTGSGNNVLSVSPDLTGTPTAPTASVSTNNTQLATTAFVRLIIPAGVILLWSGAIVAIPSGWYLCDGNNSTPDLRNRFVVGAGSTYAVGATGGSADAVVVSHTHTATSVVTDPGHSHTTKTYLSTYSPTGQSVPSQANQWGGWSGTDTATTGITVATTNTSTGVSGTNANLPPYYALAYIMKA